MNNKKSNDLNHIQKNEKELNQDISIYKQTDINRKSDLSVNVAYIQTTDSWNHPQNQVLKDYESDRYENTSSKKYFNQSTKNKSPWRGQREVYSV